MANREPFGLDEWYHCYNRGIDKRIIFTDRDDYERFMKLLFVTNNEADMQLSDVSSRSFRDIVQSKRPRTLTSIGAYCLMPNHFHLLIKETNEGGISEFMRKLGIAYAMYFNIKNGRTGNLLARPFRSRHIAKDDYIQHVLSYIHCNPAEIFEQGWKKGNVKNLGALQKKLTSYPYSSLGIFAERKHPANALLGKDIFDVARHVSIGAMIRDSHAYYAEIESSMSR